MRRRRWLGIAAACSLGTVAPRSIAQTGALPGVPLRMGFFNFGAPPEGGAPPALRRALADLGYVEGSRIVFFSRSANYDLPSLPALCDELLALKPDIIVVPGYKAAQVLKRATSSTPVVVYSAGDPVATGLAASLSAPGGNITGLSDQSAELSGKRLELLKELVPAASVVAVLWNADDLAMTLRVHEIDRAARSLHVTLQPLGVREPEEFETAFAAMRRERPDALMLVTDALTGLNRKQIIAFAATNRLATVYEYAYLVRDGGLVSYGPDPDAALARVAGFVDRIARGARARDLPIEQPERYDLYVNLRTAKALGLVVPQSVLLRASGTIE